MPDDLRRTLDSVIITQAECQLIADLAIDSEKQATYQGLVQKFQGIIDELKARLAGSDPNKNAT